MKTLINWLTAFCLLLTIALCVSDVFAAPKKISVVIHHVKEEGALPYSLAKSVVNSAVSIINSQIPTIKLDVTFLGNKRNVFKRYLKQGKDNALWIKWSRWLMKSYPQYKIRHALLPAIPTDDGRWYQIGISSASCPFSEWSPKGGGSISCAYQFRYNGKDALLRSVHVLAHELLHQLGAQHVDALPPTLMHRGTGIWEEDENANRISSRTKSQVNRCLMGGFSGGF